MTKLQKLTERLLSCPIDFTWDELTRLLSSLGYQQSNKGKTSGSRVCFVREHVMINLHKPHPRPIMKKYQLKQVIQHLQKEGLI
ncbi:TPA: type II toxin-antitoxin system HicA family toxin [Legionella feeleii]